MLSKERLVECLRQDLGHLYDPEHLRESPLARLFGVAERYDTSTALRRILTEGIAALRPPPEEPPLSRAWRMYHSLLYAYVEQFSQQDTASQLAVSPRQLRRDQRAALQALADLLWERYELGDGAGAGSEAAPDSGPADTAVDQELAWLQEASQAAPIRLDEVVTPVVDLARRLAARHRTRLEVSIPGDLPRVTVHPVALRQILLNLLSVVIPRAAEGSVHFSARTRSWQVELCLGCDAYPSGPKPPLEHEADSLSMAQRLAGLAGANLELKADARSFDARLGLPAVAQLPVLVIDDNADTLQLLQHYAAGTRYRLTVTRDPERALHLAKETRPGIIVLDVMMPQVDGWEVLAQLRQHPATSGVPIIVCTILAQKELALMLGASAFLRKPVSQQAFLTALDEQCGWPAPESG